MSSATPLFSIICPAFNCAANISLTLDSILSQKGVSVECLVVDAASTDGTLQVVAGYLSDSRVRLDSRPDRGIYDGMNRGLELARGRFLYFVGAGDSLLPGVLLRVQRHVDELPADGGKLHLLYGNVLWGRERFRYCGRFTLADMFSRNICHQAIFYDRRIFDVVGDYDLSYRTCADWELNLRCYADKAVEPLYMELDVAEYDPGYSATVLDRKFLRDFPLLIRSYFGWSYLPLLFLRVYRWPMPWLSALFSGLPAAILAAPRRRYADVRSE